MEQRIRRAANFRWLSQLGAGLVALALVFLILATYIVAFRSPWLVAYSYAVLVLGIVALVLRQVFESIQCRRLELKSVRCFECGWTGLGRDWRRYRCCPECDSEEVLVEGESWVN